MRQLSRRGFVGALGSIPVSRWLRAQQQATQVPGYSATVKVVNIFAAVRDKAGKIVTDLTQDDFLLEEDGQRQDIKYFSRETDLPLTLGLLVDTSGSERNVIGEERSASFRFLDKVMRAEKDTAFVIHFDFEVELLQDLTSSKSELQKALDRLEVGQERGGLQRRGPGGQGGGGYPPGGGRRGPGGGGTLLYDAAFLGSDEIMKKQQGRKALIVLSDGVDNGSRLTLSQAVESAQRSDTLIYTILFEDPNGNGGGRGFGGRMGGGGGGRRGIGEVDGHKVLQRLSKETGGRYFEVSKRLSIDKVYESLEEELRSQYSIGYTSNSKDASGEYRLIHLTAKQKSLVVQTREGYYPS